MLTCLGALDNVFVTDGVSNLHPRINEVLMKERMKIIEDSRCSISYFEDVSFVCRKIWTWRSKAQESSCAFVQRPLPRSNAWRSAVGRERRQPRRSRGDTRWHQVTRVLRCQVPVLEQLADHSTLLGAGVPATTSITITCQNMSGPKNPSSLSDLIYITPLLIWTSSETLCVWSYSSPSET